MAESTTDLRLASLRMRNFRCFSECEIAFHKDLTVLVADNGQGKTAIMDAAAIVLAEFVDQLAASRQSEGILASDIHLARGPDNRVSPQPPTLLRCVTKIGGIDAEWAAERKQFEKPDRRTKNALTEVRTAASAITPAREEFASNEHLPLLPVVAYYPSIRFSQNAYFGSQRNQKPVKLVDRFNGYRDFLDPLSDSLHFNEWYEQRVTAVKERPITGARLQESPLLQLTAVRAAVDDVLRPTGWGAIDWDLTQRCVVAEHRSHGRLPLAALSSGVRNMIALTADLAYRCVRLNPMLTAEATHRTPGVVLIDEVDLHLHPSWQQLVVTLLRGAFPLVQFILSTHSPQVLSTVNAESIRVIKLVDGLGRVATPQFQTRGVESADVLAAIMGVDPVPHVLESERLSDYLALIEEGRHEEEAATVLRQQLIAHFGDRHPLMLDCDRLIRFSQFKKRRAAEGGSNAQA